MNSTPTFRARSVRQAFTLLEALVVLLILVGLVLVAPMCMPGLHPNRERARRLVCSANVKGIGTSMKIYANDNGGRWPTPVFDENAIGSIDYLLPVGGGVGTPLSPDRSMESTSGPGGAVALSPSRALWMLVRSGDVTVKQFICPNSTDTDDPTGQIEAYHDFVGVGHVSYSYHMPYTRPEDRPFEGMDNRKAVAADKGPYSSSKVALPPVGMDETSARGSWTPFNSPNHAGEGQSVLFADGHVDFNWSPIAGVDHDNIYTVATGVSAADRMIGESPWKQVSAPLSLRDAKGRRMASTDSLIFP